ncbi:pre-rRNA-processing protein pno1 [Nowakowskiella sp. JEL0078]|nr:pre-rRNA-processing protein pno1 [Nowakowskiella sp. JEL0078]
MDIGNLQMEQDMEDDVKFVVNFPALSSSALTSGKIEKRRIPIPPHRMTPLKREWMSIYTPLVNHMKVQVRMNVKARSVEVRNCEETEDIGAVQKSADFVKAFSLGFDVADSIALLRMEDLYIDSFEIKDVRAVLAGDNLSRAIGRIVGKDGKTKYTIENASRTRIVIADTKIHILGTFQNIRIAKDSLVALILGSSPGKVTSNLRQVSARQRERF